jgi:D-3-phosphoglycerate dehydrogenase
LNIVTQHLQTQGGVGYAITDVDAQISETLMATLRGASTTIRCYLL